MRTVWKFNIPVEGSIAMPKGAQPLAVQIQDGAPCLWTMVDLTQPSALYPIHVIGTGHPIPDAVGRYVGTFQLAGGSLVFHLFIEMEAQDA